MLKLNYCALMRPCEGYKGRLRCKTRGKLCAHLQLRVSGQLMDRCIISCRFFISAAHMVVYHADSTSSPPRKEEIEKKKKMDL